MWVKERKLSQSQGLKVNFESCKTFMLIIFFNSFIIIKIYIKICKFVPTFMIPSLGIYLSV